MTAVKRFTEIKQLQILTMRIISQMLRVSAMQFSVDRLASISV